MVAEAQQFATLGGKERYGWREGRNVHFPGSMDFAVCPVFKRGRGREGRKGPRNTFYWHLIGTHQTCKVAVTSDHLMLRGQHEDGRTFWDNHIHSTTHPESKVAKASVRV